MCEIHYTINSLAILRFVPLSSIAVLKRPASVSSMSEMMTEDSKYYACLRYSAFFELVPSLVITG